MPESNLLILWETAPPEPVPADTCVISLQQLRNLAISGRILTQLLRYRSVELRSARLDIIPKRFLAALLCRWMCRGFRNCRFTDLAGLVQPITVGLMFKLARAEWRDRRHKPKLLQNINHQLDELLPQILAAHQRPKLDLSKLPIYLRTDLTFNLRSGGSVGHIAGVLNQLDQFACKPIFLSTDAIPTVRPDLSPRIVLPEDRFWSSTELRCLHFNTTLPDLAMRAIGDNLEPAFIYQRYSLHNFAGLLLARKLQIPFVLEFNGSELWINKHWGVGLRYPELAEKIEQVNLHGADLVVVVSQPMKDELVARGVPAEKILVNPNGVDPDRYSPHADGFPIRTQYQLQGKKVVGFIGTLGAWHGAEVLAQAFGLLLEQHPHYRQTVRLLIVGDGAKMPAVRAQLQRDHTEDLVILPGLVPQSQGPAYLAACDILASPHVPNPDGTPFFGSPTKLFEYMAMGKAIVASDLDQIGQVLAHDQTAWMVKPGDPKALAQGLHHLLENQSLRDRLGQAARQRAIDHHTWRQHTRQIIQALQERCA